MGLGRKKKPEPPPLPPLPDRTTELVAALAEQQGAIAALTESLAGLRTDIGELKEIACRRQVIRLRLVAHPTARETTK